MNKHKINKHNITKIGKNQMAVSKMSHCFKLLIDGAADQSPLIQLLSLRALYFILDDDRKKMKEKKRQT